MIFGPSISGPQISKSELSTLFAVYSFGFAGIYLAFNLLYFHAWRLRNALELSQLEKLETRYIIFWVLAVGIVGLIAAGIARISGSPSWGGLIYILLIPILRGSRMVHQRRRAAMQAAQA